MTAVGLAQYLARFSKITRAFLWPTTKAEQQGAAGDEDMKR